MSPSGAARPGPTLLSAALLPADMKGSLYLAMAPWRRCGWILVLLVLGGAVLWLANARLDSVAIGVGLVAIEETKRQTLHHREGGLISEVLVEAGDVVEAGDALIHFDDSHPRAALDLLRGRLLAMLALEAQLVAERDGAHEIAFPDELTRLSGDPDLEATIAEIMASHTEMLNAKQLGPDGRQTEVIAAINSYRAEIATLDGEIESARERLASLKKERGGVEDMVARKVVSRSALKDLDRQRAELVAGIDERRARIAQTKKAIAALETPDDPEIANDGARLASQLHDVRADLADLKEKMRAIEDVLRRTTVVAPFAATVVDVRVSADRGIVQPGQDLLDLIPRLNRRVLDVRVDPNDADRVYPGMAARIRMATFDVRAMPMLSGVVSAVSTEPRIDPLTGESYLPVWVVFATDMAVDERDRLKPGMQAEVFLVVRDRTALDELIAALSRALDRVLGV